MKLQEWARLNGISRSTALRLHKQGKLPYHSEQISPKIIIINIPDNNENNNKTVAYARISTHKQKQDLQNQKLRILEYAVKNNIKIDETYEEIASGLNENRRILNKILSDKTITTIIIEHRERLTRLNFKLIESTLKAQNRKIIIIDPSEIEDDLIRDTTEILTSICAKFYGKRGAKNKAQKIVNENGFKEVDNDKINK